MAMKTLFDIFAPAESWNVEDGRKPDEDAVRELAYHLWEEAGRPEGDGVDFWVRAEQELSAN